MSSELTNKQFLHLFVRVLIAGTAGIMEEIKETNAKVVFSGFLVDATEKT
jgi:hypothetical protein